MVAAIRIDGWRMPRVETIEPLLIARIEDWAACGGKRDIAPVTAQGVWLLGLLEKVHCVLVNPGPQ